MTESTRFVRGLLFNFAKEHPAQFGHVLASCPQHETSDILGMLPTASLIEVLAYAPRQVTTDYLDTQPFDSILKWIHQGSNDAVARIARRLSDSVRANLLTQVKDVKKLRVLREYVHFSTNSVAALADKNFIAYSSAMTCEEVRKCIRNLNSDEADNILIVDSQDRVLGLLDDRRILCSGSEEPIRSCVKRTTLLPANAPTKAAVEIDDWHRVDRLPVIDQNGRAIGMLRWKQLIEREDSRIDHSSIESQTLVMDVVNTMFDVIKDLPRPNRSHRP